MSTTLTTQVNALVKMPKITDAAANRLIQTVNKDEKVTRTEAKALGKIAALPDDRWVNQADNDVWRDTITEVRDYADTANKLFDMHFKVTSSVPGVDVKLGGTLKVVNEDVFNDMGQAVSSHDEYQRTLGVTITGNKLVKDGTLSFEYGKFKVNVEVKKGMSRETLFNRIESKLLRQQGALSVEGFDPGSRAHKATIKYSVWPGK